jgi:hypothetical protein
MEEEEKEEKNEGFTRPGEDFVAPVKDNQGSSLTWILLCVCEVIAQKRQHRLKWHYWHTKDMTTQIIQSFKKSQQYQFFADFLKLF